MSAKSVATMPKITHVTVLLGNVNAKRLARQRPELFDPQTAIVKRNIPTAYVGARADFPGDNEFWRKHCADVFANVAARADAHATELAMLSAGKYLTVIYSAATFEHDPSNGIYCPIPNPTAYRELLDCADEGVQVSEQ